MAAVNLVPHRRTRDRVGAVAAGGGAFSDPSDIGSLRAWWDASDTATITDAGAGAVSAWADKSGNGYTLSQATSTKRPTTGTRTLNSLNLIDFDGVDNVLATSATVTLDTVHTLFVVMVPDTAAADQIIVEASADTNANEGMFLAILSSGVWESFVHGSTISNEVASTKDWSTVPTASGQILTRRNNGTHASHTFRRNGADQGAGTSPPLYNDNTGTVAINDIVYVGGRGTTPVAPLNAALAEIVIYDIHLSDSQVADVEAYLAGKWGITI